MIVHPKDLEYDLKNKDRLKAHLDDAVLIDGVDRELADSLTEGLGDPFFKETHQFCFACGERLVIPAVMWAGVNGKSREATEIWLHPHCVEGLAHRLLRDVNELKHDKSTADAALDQWKAKERKGL